MDVKQIKLVTGEEILCRVVEEDEFDIIIKDALKIISRYTETGIRYYSFRSFMVYKERSDDLIVIRADKVVAYSSVDDALLREYVIGLKDLYGEEREKVSIPAEEEYDSGTNVIPFKPLIH